MFVRVNSNQIGWINIRNLVPAGLLCDDKHLLVKNRKESPAEDVEDVQQLLAKLGLRETLDTNHPINKKTWLEVCGEVLDDGILRLRIHQTPIYSSEDAGE